MADAEPDFSNYMEQLQAVEAEKAKDEAMYNAHEVSRPFSFLLARVTGGLLRASCPSIQYELTTCSAI